MTCDAKTARVETGSFKPSLFIAPTKKLHAISLLFLTLCSSATFADPPETSTSPATEGEKLKLTH